jgi:hypothetical protein
MLFYVVVCVILKNNCFILQPSLLFPILVFHFWYPITIFIVVSIVLSPYMLSSCHSRHSICLFMSFYYHPLCFHHCSFCSITIHVVPHCPFHHFVTGPYIQKFPIFMRAKLQHLVNYSVSIQSHFDLEFLLNQ